MDPSVIIVLVLIFCLCVGVGITGFWTCTGGTWDTDKFDTSLCLTIPSSKEKDPVVDGDPPPPPRDPPASERSNVYSNCAGMYTLDATNTCFNTDNGSAGVRWIWVEKEGSNVCQEATTKWRIDVSSSNDNHATKYAYVIDAPKANSFGFTGAPSGFLKDRNISFWVSALDKDNKINTKPEYINMTPISESKNCGDHGISPLINWANMTTSTELDEENKSLEDKDCEGGEWEPGPWICDGEEIAEADMKVSCGPACTRKKTRINFEDVQNAGTCVYDRTEIHNRESCSPFVAEAIDHGPVTWVAVVNPDGTTCSKPCGDDGIQKQTANYTSHSGGGTPYEGDTEKTVACNRHPCARPCIGSFVDSYCSITTGEFEFKYADYIQLYKITQTKIGDGADCPHVENEKAERKVYNETCTASLPSRWTYFSDFPNWRDFPNWDKYK